MFFLKQIFLLGLIFLSSNIHTLQNSYAHIDNNEITLQNSLKHWDQVVRQLTAKTPLFDRGEDRLRAYLFHAQKKFVEVFFVDNGCYPQNVDAISLHMIQLFYPNYQEKISLDVDSRVQSAMDQRFKEEQVNLTPIPLQNQENAWSGTKPYHGLEIPNWKPWVLKSASEFRLPPPPESSESLFWQNQLHEIREEMNKANNSQKQRILFWANMADIGAGDWVYILNKYMKEAKIPLMTQLKVRDAVGMAIVDATIAAFDTKYSYLIKRPSMFDSSLKTYIDTPNHPSFPSAHSTVSFAVLEVLQYYLPENQLEWQKLAEEAGMSRILAGIHFPIDHQAGKKLGKKIGQAILLRTAYTERE